MIVPCPMSQKSQVKIAFGLGSWDSWDLGHNMIARKFIIKGRVQGVGFRCFVQRSAAKHQVKGYVRNLENGDVECYAEGAEKSVELFKHDLTAGPTYSRVEEIEEVVLEPGGLYPSFRIER